MPDIIRSGDGLFSARAIPTPSLVGNPPNWRVPWTLLPPDQRPFSLKAPRNDERSAGVAIFKLLFRRLSGLGLAVRGRRLIPHPQNGDQANARADDHENA